MRRDEYITGAQQPRPLLLRNASSADHAILQTVLNDGGIHQMLVVSIPDQQKSRLWHTAAYLGNSCRKHIDAMPTSKGSGKSDDRLRATAPQFLSQTLPFERRRWSIGNRINAIKIN